MWVDAVVESIFDQPLGGNGTNFDAYSSLLGSLAIQGQISVFKTLLRICSKRFSSCQEKGKVVGGIAAFVAALIQDKPYLQVALLEWLGSGSGGSVGVDIYTNRGVIAALRPYTGKKIPLSLRFS